MHGHEASYQSSRATCRCLVLAYVAGANGLRENRERRHRSLADDATNHRGTQTRALGTKDRMRQSKQTYLAPLLAAAVLVACSSEEASTASPTAPDGGASSAPVTPEAACEHEFRVGFERCIKGSIAPATITSARTRYVTDCVTSLSLSGSTRTADEVEACANAVEAEECGVFAEFLPACAPKAGTLATGSACNVDGQCQSGYCELRAQGKGCGVCAATPAEGDGCSAERPVCAVGTFCEGEPKSSRTSCKRIHYADANAACNGFDIRCRPGFICAAVDGAKPVCLPALAAGQECRDDAACAKEAFCSRQSGKCTNRGKTGDACDGLNSCSEGFGCDRTTQKCAPLTFVEPGEDCGGSVACREGVCGQGTGAPRCPAIVEDGKGCLEGAHMTCRAPAACIAGACVMPTTATCK